MAPVYKHFVIADDDEDDIESFRSALEEFCPGLTLTVATDGVKLIKLLSKIPCPDAIVLDLNMPNKNGKECLIEIRKNQRFKEVPVIILSTSTHKEEIADCLQHGANNYYVKPVSHAGMKDIVESLCSDTTPDFVTAPFGH